MHNSKNTLATNPVAMFVTNLAIVQYSCLVELDTSSVYSSSKRNFIRMEVFPAGLSNDLLRQVSEDVSDGV